MSEFNNEIASQIKNIASRVPKDFILGTASSSWQIEGDSANRGRCIWDDFAAVKGNILDFTQGDPAADHIKRWESDLDLMKWMGADAYRFSISWPRVIPDGSGKINEKGLAFYDKLIDGLLERNISPVLTMYHWDLPSALETKGGWLWEGIADTFGEYAELLASRFADRVDMWATLNEPWVSAYLGYATKIHAPGAGVPAQGFESAYRLMLSHARGMEVLRRHNAKKPGLVLNLTTMIAEDEGAKPAAHHMDGLQNRFFLDLLAGRGIPKDILENTKKYSDWSFVKDSELKEMTTPIDWLGINYYTPSRISHSDATDAGYINGQNNDLFPGTPPVNFVPRPRRSQMGWEVDAPSLITTLKTTSERLPGVPLYITENGGAFEDYEKNGEFDDPERLAYYSEHIDATLSARESGVDVRGYFAWSLLDNIEWAEGWTKRFGITHVDLQTQKRTPKSSGKFIREIMRSRSK